MTGANFLQHFHAVLPPEWEGVIDKPSSLKDQTQYMVRRLHKLAHLNGLYCCCEYASHQNPSSRQSIEVRGQTKEYMFDLTWYRDWTYWRQPDVIIEHECLGSVQEFIFDFWKLLVGYAPLRVMIGYARNPAACQDIVDAINSYQNSAGWHFPQDVEDVVLIGYSYMAPRHFRVLYRQNGRNIFDDLGWLSDVVE